MSSHLLILNLFHILRGSLPLRVQDQALVVLCLAENTSPGREESRSIVDGLVYGAHVRLGFFERCVNAFDHFVDLADSFQLSLQACISRLVCIVAVFCARRLVGRSIVIGSVFLRSCAALRTRKQILFVFVLQAQASYVGCICGPRHFRPGRFGTCFERVVSRVWVLALGWVTLIVCVLCCGVTCGVSAWVCLKMGLAQGRCRFRESGRTAGAGMELVKLTVRSWTHRPIIVFHLIWSAFCYSCYLRYGVVCIS
jgi:hypothetical protein